MLMHANQNCVCLWYVSEWEEPEQAVCCCSAHAAMPLWGHVVSRSLESPASCSAHPSAFLAQPPRRETSSDSETTHRAPDGKAWGVQHTEAGLFEAFAYRGAHSNKRTSFGVYDSEAQAGAARDLGVLWARQRAGSESGRGWGGAAAHSSRPGVQSTQQAPVYLFAAAKEVALPATVPARLLLVL